MAQLLIIIIMVDSKHDYVRMSKDVVWGPTMSFFLLGSRFFALATLCHVSLSVWVELSVAPPLKIA